MESPFIEQARRNINLLINAGRFREAHNLCNDILSRYPEQREFEKTRDFIEKESKKANEELIDQKIEELKPLWEQEKYAEILNALKYLFKYAPDNSRLEKLQKKAQNLYSDQIKTLRKKFKNEQVEKLTRLLKEDPEKLMRELVLLEHTNPGNPDVVELSDTFRGKYVEKKIKEKEDLIYSDKYDVIESFVESLKKIDEKNTEVMKLEKLVKQRKLDNQLEEKKEYIFKGENYLSTLLRLGKYAEAIKVAKEILSIDKNDKEAQKLLKKAEAAYFDKTRDQTIDMIDKDFEKLKQEYSSSKSKFVKI